MIARGRLGIGREGSTEGTGSGLRLSAERTAEGGGGGEAAGKGDVGDARTGMAKHDNGFLEAKFNNRVRVRLRILLGRCSKMHTGTFSTCHSKQVGEPVGLSLVGLLRWRVEAAQMASSRCHEKINFSFHLPQPECPAPRKVLCVALDYAKYKHMALCCGSNGEILQKPFVNDNTVESITFLIEQISATARGRKIPKCNIFFGGEDEPSYIAKFMATYPDSDARASMLQ